MPQLMVFWWIYGRKTICLVSRKVDRPVSRALLNIAGTTADRLVKGLGLTLRSFFSLSDSFLHSPLASITLSPPTRKHLYAR